MEIALRVAQESIFGPDLWNASYDGLLKLDMQDELRGWRFTILGIYVPLTVCFLLGHGRRHPHFFYNEKRRILFFNAE